MSRRHISQREAHRLEKLVAELERQQNRQRFRWAQDHPGGTHLGYIKRDRDWFSGRLECAAKLGHAIVAKPDDNGQIDFYALELPK